MPIKKPQKPKCNPPYDCLNGKCPYEDDCHFDGLATKGETKALKAGRLPQGRPGQSSNFDRIDDILYNFRSRRLI